jgi:transglutaminase-like putative cysteine protease
VTSKARELESLLLSMFAAVPLYFTYTIGIVPLILFHVAMAAIVVRVAMGRGTDLLPARLMRWLAIGYLPFYIVDWRLFSGSALGASAHLVLFIAVYQPMESAQKSNHAQRMLTTVLIFVASLATSTHIAVLPFVVVFAFFTFRQLMDVSHVETARSLGRVYGDVPRSRAASFYLMGAMGIGAVLFPFLPRIRSPFLQGMSGPLGGSSTALSETIDFSKPRVSSGDTVVVARVWMNPQASALFAPIRLRGTLYDRYSNGEWRQSYRGFRDVPAQAGVFALARVAGPAREITVQQRPQRGRLFLPVGTYALEGVSSRLYEGPARETYYTYQDGMLNLTASVALATEPLTPGRIVVPGYPVNDRVKALARRIVGTEQRPERQAALIEQYLSHNFRYVANPGSLGRIMSVDDFLLRDRVGHCEYFAAGMVALLTALDVPSRIAGGFYGGRYNPLGGYYAIRRDDAHAWTEVWTGTRWATFDSTPPALRPGAETSGAIREYLVGLADSMTFLWDRYVLTFSLGDQISLAEDALTYSRAAAASLRARLSAGLFSGGTSVPVPKPGALATLVIVGAIAAFLLLRRRRSVFHVLARHLAARGIEIGPAMTMEEALRALQAQQPETARALEPLVRMYEEEVFSVHRDRTRASNLRRRLAQMKI